MAHSTGTQHRAFNPLALHRRPMAWKVAAVVAAGFVLALSSYVTVPMLPVPMTLQSLAVVLVGALYGWRLGAITVVLWLVAGAAGLPVLAGGTAGAGRFAGPTGGYLLAFPLAAMAVGWLAERGWNGERIGLAFAGMLAGHGLCLGLGAAWLALHLGVERAVMAGVVPFLSGAVLKSLLGAVCLALLTRGLRQEK